MVVTAWRRAGALVSVACLLAASCTSLETVAVPDAASPPALPAVEVGDVVDISTRTHGKKRFEVTSVEPDALAGKDVRVAYADMETLRVQQFRKGRTVALVTAAVLTALVVVSAHDAMKGFATIFTPKE